MSAEESRSRGDRQRQRRFARARQACPRARAALWPWRLGAGRGPVRSGGAARGAGGRPGRGSDPDPLRADARVAVRVLPGRGGGHGRRPRGDVELGDHRPGLRGCPPGQLRRLRGAGPAADLRHQRLRRDAPGALGMGRQAPRREPRGRDARPRVRAQAASAHRPVRGDGVPRADAPAGGDGEPRGLVRARRPGAAARPVRRRGRRGEHRDVRQEPRQGEAEDLRAGVREACPRGRRRGSDRQRPAV